MKIKNYSHFLNESIGDKEKVYNLLNSLRYFIIDRGGLNMRDVIDRLLKEESSEKDYNDEYQLPLSLLYKTGKFKDIKQVDGKWQTKSLSNLSRVIDDKGEWHPVNKLNTNYSDASKLLADLFEKMGISDSILQQRSPGVGPEARYVSMDTLKFFLIGFKHENDIYSLIKKHIPDIKIYTEKNREYSKIGKLTEDKIAEILKSKGSKILYQGGDGDFIDMIYGVDLIIGNNRGDIRLIQVKSRAQDAKSAFEGSIKGKNNYSKIDWFCAPVGSSGIAIYTEKFPEGKIV